MSDKTFDFDQFWAETMPDEAQRPKVRIFGEDILLPANPPARVMLWAMRAAEQGEDGEAVLSSGEIYKITCAFYGTDRVEGWFDKGMTLAQLGSVFQHTIALYNRGGNDADVGNETAPTTGAKARSSRIGT